MKKMEKRFFAGIVLALAMVFVLGLAGCGGGLTGKWVLSEGEFSYKPPAEVPLQDMANNNLGVDGGLNFIDGKEVVFLTPAGGSMIYVRYGYKTSGDRLQVFDSSGNTMLDVAYEVDGDTLTLTGGDGTVTVFTRAE
jgi:hypothetical protein